MDLFEAIETRHSTRAFKKKEVEQEKIDKILAAAIRAPSAGNMQPWEFIVVKNKDTKEKIAQIALEQDFVAEAPVVIIVCADTERSASRYGSRGREFYCVQDCANATILLFLAAHAQGLGAVWVGAFNEAELQKFLKMPAHVRPMAIIPIGYADEEPEISERTNVEEVIHKEKY